MSQRQKRNRPLGGPQAEQQGAAASSDDEDQFSETSRLTSKDGTPDNDSSKATGTSTVGAATPHGDSANDQQSGTVVATSTASGGGGMAGMVDYLLSFCASGGSNSDTPDPADAAPCPLLPHENWAEALVKSLGKDVTSVSRDFTRLNVKVVLCSPHFRPTVAPSGSGSAKDPLPTELHPRAPTVEAAHFFNPMSNSRAGVLELSPPHREPDGDSTGVNNQAMPSISRRERVIDSLTKIVGMSECASFGLVQPPATNSDGDSYNDGKNKVSTPNSGRSPTQAAHLLSIVDRVIGLEDSDLSHGLTLALEEAGYIYKNPDYDPKATPPPPNSPLPSVIRHRVYLPVPRCMAIDVLMCFAQGIIFFPSQRLKYLIWTPWAAHLQDLGWSCSVFRLTNPNQIQVWHEQTLENNLAILDEADRKHCPVFNVSWKLSLVLALPSSSATNDEREQQGTSTRTEEAQQQPKVVTNQSSGKEMVADAEQFTQYFKTARVKSVAMEVTRWSWKEPVGRKSVKYQKRQAQFQKIMYDRFQLQPFE